MAASRRVLIVVAPERFRDEELGRPRQLLEGAGHSVTITSTRRGTAIGMLGARVAVDASVSQFDDAAVDALILVGGNGAPLHLWENEPLRLLTQAMHAAGKPIGAQCLATPMLARAGLLSGRRATTFPDARAIIELKRGGATYVDEPVVQHGTIVTGNGPDAASAFGAVLANLVSA